MRAKTLTNNLKWRNSNRGDRGYSVGRKWRLYRGFLTNEQVRYRTKHGGIMFCDSGENYEMVKI